MLLNLKNVSLSLGRSVVLDHAQLTIERGERVCLVGRNGTGKSTLMRLINGSQQPDDGEIVIDSGARISELPQDVPPGTDGSVFDVVAEGLGEAGRLVAEYHHLIESGSEDMGHLGRVQAALEAVDGWSLDARVETILTKLKLPADAVFASLSGGLKRRVLLGQALVAEPDLLLLDEPTNHLDIDSIAWIEDFLVDWPGTLLFVTHDRAFLRRVASRIVELDRGTLSSWPGTYDDYLRRKEDALQAEAQQNALFDKKLAEEETWIRKGIQARRTRNEGRVRALYALREDFASRRNLSGKAKMQVQEAERSGKMVVEAEGLQFAHGERLLVRNFSATVLRGEKIGLIGPNGVGKTTLLKLLLGSLQPDQGTVRLGTKLEIAVFDQLRTALDAERPVWEQIADGREFIESPQGRKHVMGYLQDFLFTPDRARSPIKALSGGERSRVMLARLFAQPTNLLVLDEPTNDLDIETLDLLEEQLSEYSGTVLLVSHDREFLDRVVTRSFVFEGAGRIGDFIGGYSEWRRQVAAMPTSAPVANRSATKASTRAPAPAVAGRLSNQEKRELDALPQQIEALEGEQAQLASVLADPELYIRDRADAVSKQQRASEIEQALLLAYERWEALEALR